MRALDPGHRYSLQNLDNPSQVQILQFIHKRPAIAPDGSSIFETIADGTTNEEVLAMLIDRLEELSAKMASPYNRKALEHIRAALKELNRRTEDRKQRGVEGTPLP